VLTERSAHGPLAHAATAAAHEAFDAFLAAFGVPDAADGGETPRARAA
jgi:hypothetical protein